MRPALAAPAIILAFAASAAAQTGAALPDPNQLLQRALANQRKQAAELERYQCRVTTESDELD